MRTTKVKTLRMLSWLSIASVAIVTVACGTFIVTSKKQDINTTKPSSAKVGQKRVEKIGDMPSRELDLSSIIKFVNEQKGWLSVGERLWRTVNGGRSWEFVYSGDARFGTIDSLEFINSQVGWMLVSGEIYKTEDGGFTWTKLTNPFSNVLITSFKFLKDGEHGWATGAIYRPLSKELRNLPNSYISRDGKKVIYGAISYTTDGGKNWTQQSIPLEVGSISYLFMLDEGHAWALSGKSVFRLQNDKWTKIDFPEAFCRTKESSVTTNIEDDEENVLTAESIYFVDSQTGWISFTNGFLAQSVDGGQTWCNNLEPESVWPTQTLTAYFYKIYFSDKKKGWGLDGNDNLHETSDGGITWNRIEADMEFEDMYFLDANHGWAISKEGLYRIRQ